MLANLSVTLPLAYLGLIINNAFAAPTRSEESCAEVSKQYTRAIQANISIAMYKSPTQPDPLMNVQPNPHSPAIWCTNV